MIFLIPIVNLDDDDEDGGLFGDEPEETEQKGIMAADFFAPRSGWNPWPFITFLYWKDFPPYSSTFEKRSKRVREELDELEAEQIKEKPWHLMGETTARQRDGDELLAMDLDYEAARPAVAPTVQMTEELENIIIQRIRDKGKSN